jgi:hypothetical protein
LKRLALRQLITPLLGVFDQTFFEKVCDQAFFEKVCAVPVNHAGLGLWSSFPPERLRLKLNLFSINQ